MKLRVSEKRIYPLENTRKTPVFNMFISEKEIGSFSESLTSYVSIKYRTWDLGAKQLNSEWAVVPRVLCSACVFGVCAFLTFI